MGTLISKSIHRLSYLPPIHGDTTHVCYISY